MPHGFRADIDTTQHIVFIYILTYKRCTGILDSTKSSFLSLTVLSALRGGDADFIDLGAMADTVCQAIEDWQDLDDKLRAHYHVELSEEERAQFGFVKKDDADTADEQE